MEQLQSEIHDLMTTNDSNRAYIPEASFLTMMSTEKVRAALADSGIKQYQQNEVTKRICERGRKVFGILVLMNSISFLSKFIELEYLDDAKLPLRKETLEEGIRLTSTNARRFLKEQWLFLSPTFRLGTLNRCLSGAIVLPFVTSKKIGSGAFGIVYEVALDPHHQQINDIFPAKVRLPDIPFNGTVIHIIKFAMKEFGDVDLHQKELENLSILNHIKHPNIVELLSSYTYDNKRHCLLFPLAEDQDLRKFLAKPRQSTDLSDEDLMIALCGLSSAVAHLHNFSGKKLNLEFIGCHHDLRPANVLVSGKSFILADFGISKFKDRSENSETPARARDDDYLAPECRDLYNGFKAGVIHRSSDIWSLGCIITEVVQYIRCGAQGVKSFRLERKFHVEGFEMNTFHQGNNLPSKPVQDWLAQLDDSPRITYVLISRLVRKTLSLDPSERTSASEITVWLQFVVLCEVGLTINTLFSNIRNSNPSLDIFLEHLKFNSWRHSTGMLSPEDFSSLPNHLEEGTLSQYDGILSCLFHLRDHLQLRASTDKIMHHLNMSELISFNHQLKCFLSREQQETSRKYFEIALVQEDKSNTYRKLLDQEDNSVALDDEIRMRLKLKYIYALISADSAVEFSEKQIPSKNVKIGHDQSIGEYDDGSEQHSVWIEWRKYKRHDADEKTMEMLLKRISGMAEMLAQEKPPTFRTLTCSGFYHDPTMQAFGMIFKMPQTISQKPDAIRLDRLIEVTREPKTLPDLDDKFTLAAALATSLFQFHTMGWLHKNLTASNIVFFRNSAEDPTGDIIQKPWLVGFNDSRPNDQWAFTSGIDDQTSDRYQHPAYLKGDCNYRAEFDYYSLGILLLQIGLWLPLKEKSFGTTPKERAHAFEKERKVILQRQVPQLKKYMGRKYSEIVRFCIAINVGEPESSKEDVLLEFSTKVVVPLGKLLN